MQHPVPLEGLVERLRASRIRLMGRRLLLASIWTAMVAAGVFLVLELLQYLGIATLPEGTVPLISLSLFVAGILFSLLHIWRTAPDVISLARLAERHYGLEERLSTALEGGDAEGALIRMALLEDVARRADRIRATELIKIPLPRPVWYLIAVMSAGLLLQLAPVPSGGTVGSAVVPMTDEERAETVAQVRRVASLVAQDAEQRNDTYLRALAQALERLGSDIEHELLDADVVERELARLVDHLVQAYGLEERFGAGADFAALLSPGEGGLPENETAPSGSLPIDDHALIEAREMGRIDTDRTASDLRSTLEDLVAHLEADDGGQQQAVEGIGEAAQVRMQTYGYDQIDPELRARIEREREIMARLRPEVPMGGDMGGAGDGASAEAGVGSQPLFDEDGQPLSVWETLDNEEVELPFDPEASQRIRVEAAPPLDLSVVDATGVAGSGWRRHEERAKWRSFIEMGNRAIVSRYFMPIDEARE